MTIYECERCRGDFLGDGCPCTRFTEKQDVNRDEYPDHCELHDAYLHGCRDCKVAMRESFERIVADHKAALSQLDTESQPPPQQVELEEIIAVACQKTRMIPSGVSQKEYSRLKRFYVSEATAALLAWKDREVEKAVGQFRGNNNA